MPLSTDAPKIVPTPIAPVAVTVIGTGPDPGAAPLTTGTVAVTPDHQPNVMVNVITPFVAIMVRFGNNFCVSLAGSLAAGGMTSKVMPHSDFVGLVEPAVILALCIAGVGLVKDFATVFSGLEKRFPLASGSV